MKKILLIEDNDQIREMTSDILELAGYDVCTAENGKIGVEAAKKETPDIIICDVTMPELDGYGVLHILSKEPSTMGIPFIFLTANSDKSDMRKGMNMGADDYLTKPFEEAELLNIVELRIKRNDYFKKTYTRDLSGLISFVNTAKDFVFPNKIAAEYKIREYGKKDSIYLEGYTPNFVYFIHKGKVKTFRQNPDGKEFITGTYSKGDFFGHISVLEGSLYNDSAATLTDCELARIPKEDFIALVYSNNEISARFIKMLANNINEHEKRLIALAYNSVRARTASVLLDLQKKTNSETINIPREDLANMVGTTFESISRTLTDFKTDKLINLKGKDVVVKDVPGLEKVIKFS